MAGVWVSAGDSVGFSAGGSAGGPFGWRVVRRAGGGKHFILQDIAGIL